jgi:hypothetical protein
MGFPGFGRAILHNQHFGQWLRLHSVLSSLFEFYEASVDIFNCAFDSVRSNFGATIISLPGLLVIRTIKETVQLSFRIVAFEMSFFWRARWLFPHSSCDTHSFCCCDFSEFFYSSVLCRIYLFHIADRSFRQRSFENNTAAVDDCNCSIEYLDRSHLEKCRFRFTGRNG